MKENSKVFCVGFNKTGTTSLHELFKSLGWKSYHGIYSDYANKGDFSNRIFKDYQCFSDGESHDFKALDKAFPGSKFILTTRRMDKWLLSRIKHVHYRRSVGKTGWMRKEYEKDPDLAIRNWIARRKKYYEEIRGYFAGRTNDYVEINICDGKETNVLSILAEFLGIRDNKELRMPKRNVHGKKVSPTIWKRVLLRLGIYKEFSFDTGLYERQIEKAFADLGIIEKERTSDQ